MHSIANSRHSVFRVPSILVTLLPDLLVSCLCHKLISLVFQVALFQLPDVTLMVSVYSKRSMKRKEMVGWFSLGLNSSGEEELGHWHDMRDGRGEQICRWHILADV